MVKGIKYESFCYCFKAQDINKRGSLGRKDTEEMKNIRSYYFGEEDLDNEITTFKARHEADGVEQKYYNEFCREWEKDGKRYLEYIMGFVPDGQSSTDFKKLIGHE